MVTAGVYLLMRLSYVLESSGTSQLIITWLGGLSAIFGAAAGVVETDLKKVIAYSTTSQLGYMVVASGLSQYSLALFHLINHAQFKALMFLSVGAVIYQIDQQDQRKMGSMVQFNPETSQFVLVATISLLAFPFVTGFYSKDLLLNIAVIPRNATNTIAQILTVLAAFVTACYSVRLIILCFITPSHLSYMFADFASKQTVLMTIPLVSLTFGAVVFGYLTSELFLGLQSYYQGALFRHPDHLVHVEQLFLPLLTLLILLLLVPVKPILNMSLSLHRNQFLCSFVNHFNTVNGWIIHIYLAFALVLVRYWDRGVLEATLGTTGLQNLFHYYSFKLELVTTGFIPHYIQYILLFKLRINVQHLHYSYHVNSTYANHTTLTSIK